MTMTCDADLRGVAMRLLAPVTVRAMKKADGDHPAKVKQLMEAVA